MQKEVQETAETAQGQHQMEPVTESKELLGVPVSMGGREGSKHKQKKTKKLIQPNNPLPDIPVWLQTSQKTNLKMKME